MLISNSYFISSENSWARESRVAPKIMSSNINLSNELVSTLISDKQGSISLSPCKPFGQKICGEALIPCSRSLLKAIESFLHLVDMLGMMRILKSFRLFYIKFFLKNVV